jgi:ribonuclease HI
MTTNEVIIYTDGAARNNPGRGGYGAILMYKNTKKEIAQGYTHSTNNRMELMAVIQALHLLTRDNLNVSIYTDSQYIVHSVTKGWLNTWLKTHFKGDKKNPDLWLQYHLISKKHQVSFVWVKGHAENPYNNRCDALATAAADDIANLIEDIGYGNEKKEYLNLLNQY